jgi:hypothetical protein
MNLGPPPERSHAPRAVSARRAVCGILLLNHRHPKEAEGIEQSGPLDPPSTTPSPGSSQGSLRHARPAASWTEASPTSPHEPNARRGLPSTWRPERRSRCAVPLPASTFPRTQTSRRVTLRQLPGHRPPTRVPQTLHRDTNPWMARRRCTRRHGLFGADCHSGTLGPEAGTKTATKRSGPPPFKDAGRGSDSITCGARGERSGPGTAKDSCGRDT